MTEKDTKDILEQVLSSGCFPSASKPDDVARAVYAVLQHCIDARRQWVVAMDLCQQFYDGNQIRVRKNQPNIVENQIKVAIATVRPRIAGNVKDTEIACEGDGDPDALDALSLRVEYGCHQSHLEQTIIPDLIKDQLILGGGILKADKDVTVHKCDPKAMFWTPEGSFDDAWYIGEQMLLLTGEAKRLFGKALKASGDLTGSTKELETKQNETNAPPGTVTSSVNDPVVTTSAVDQTTPVRRYVAGAFGTSFEKVPRLWVVELWVHDQTMNGEELLYPNGRLINVLIGANDSGIQNGEDLQTLMDRPQPFERMAEMSGRWHPYAYAQYDSRNTVWSNSLVTDLIPLQRGLNDAWNTYAKNEKLCNNPTRIASKTLGLKKGDVTNQPGEIYLVPSEYAFPANTAMQWIQPPILAPHFVTKREAFLDAIRDVSGIVNIMRGEPNSNTQSGRALDTLTQNATERISSPSDAISDAVTIIKENLAYIAQDFDENGFVVPDDSVDNPRESVQYDPNQSRNATIRVITIPKIQTDEMVGIMSAVADLEAKGQPGELLLKGIKDPRLYQLFIQKKQENIARAQAQAQQDQQAQNTPKISISVNYADTPIAAQAQILALAGVKIDPVALQAEQRQQQAQDHASQVDQEVRNIGGELAKSAIESSTKAEKSGKSNAHEKS